GDPARAHAHRSDQRRAARAGRVAHAHRSRGAFAVRPGRRRTGRRWPRGSGVTSAPVRLLALRGAITCDENTKSEIDTKTQTLVREMLERNEIDHDDIVSMIFTATDDLTAEFPATAARSLGLGDIPLLCARELGIEHGMPRCIRVLMHLQ